MNERELLADCLRRLNRTGVIYYLTGSMASNYWGIPRSTHDVDFVVQLPVASVPVIVREFSDHFYIEEKAVHAAFEPPHQFNAIDTRSALKVDFWLAKSDPFDQEMLSRRQQITLFGEPAWISTAEDVILHKLFWNQISPSDRQLGDAAGVLAVQAEALDKTYLNQWGAKLNVADELDRLLSGKIKPKTT
jgi:hypothetical protein